MWELIATWPLWLQIVVPLAVTIGAGMLAFFGNLSIRWGWLKLGLKGLRRRSCLDCSSMIVSKTIDHYSTIDSYKKVLDEQMTYASHIIDGIHLDIMKTYRSIISKFREDKDKPDSDRENKEYIFFRETVSNAFDLVKKELRRSFKENGFPKMSGKEFSGYCKTQSSNVHDIISRYIMDTYPAHGTIVPIQEAMVLVNQDKLEDAIFDIYTNAKEVKRESESRVASEQERFKTEIREFIGV